MPLRPIHVPANNKQSALGPYLRTPSEEDASDLPRRPEEILVILFGESGPANESGEHSSSEFEQKILIGMAEGTLTARGWLADKKNDPGLKRDRAPSQTHLLEGDSPAAALNAIAS